MNSIFYNLLMSTILHHFVNAGFLARLHKCLTAMQNSSPDVFESFNLETEFHYADLTVINKFKKYYVTPRKIGGVTSGENEKTICEEISHDLHRNHKRLIQNAIFAYEGKQSNSSNNSPIDDICITLPAKSNWEGPENSPLCKRKFVSQPKQMKTKSYKWKYRKVKCQIFLAGKKSVEFFIAEGPAESKHTRGYFIFSSNRRVKNFFELYLTDYVWLYSKNKIKKIVADYESEVNYFPDPIPITNLLENSKCSSRNFGDTTETYPQNQPLFPSTAFISNTEATNKVRKNYFDFASQSSVNANSSENTGNTEQIKPIPSELKKTIKEIRTKTENNTVISKNISVFAKRTQDYPGRKIPQQYATKIGPTLFYANRNNANHPQARSLDSEFGNTREELFHKKLVERPRVVNDKVNVEIGDRIKKNISPNQKVTTNERKDAKSFYKSIRNRTDDQRILAEMKMNQYAQKPIFRNPNVKQQIWEPENSKNLVKRIIKRDSKTEVSKFVNSLNQPDSQESTPKTRTKTESKMTIFPESKVDQENEHRKISPASERENEMEIPKKKNRNDTEKFDDRPVSDKNIKKPKNTDDDKKTGILKHVIYNSENPDVKKTGEGKSSPHCETEKETTENVPVINPERDAKDCIREIRQSNAADRDSNNEAFQPQRENKPLNHAKIRKLPMKNADIKKKLGETDQSVRNFRDEMINKIMTGSSDSDEISGMSRKSALLGLRSRVYTPKSRANKIKKNNSKNSNDEKATRLKKSLGNKDRKEKNEYLLKKKNYKINSDGGDSISPEMESRDSLDKRKDKNHSKNLNTGGKNDNVKNVNSAESQTVCEKDRQKGKSVIIGETEHERPTGGEINLGETSTLRNRGKIPNKIEPAVRFKSRCVSSGKSEKNKSQMRISVKRSPKIVGIPFKKFLVPDFKNAFFKRK